MKLLLDANISWRLVSFLAPHFISVDHVTSLPVSQPATDETIWTYAQQHNCCIVANDEDFLRFLMQRNFPPKIVLLRMGNQSTSFVGEALVRHKEDLLAFEASHEQGLLEIYG
jgi:predicted nuclease of predicted toxin-antitoxin system